MVFAEATVPQDLIWRLDIDQYHAMVNAGILTNDDPVELLEGLLILKMPKKPEHRAATKLLRTALDTLTPDGWYVDSQEPITLSDSEPEPDVMVIQGNTRQYLDRHPGPADLAIVIEVSDTTLQRDRDIKKRTYARASIPFYWIVNLPARQIEVYSQPNNLNEDPDYQQRQDFSLGSEIPVVIANQSVGAIAVAEILP